MKIARDLVHLLRNHTEGMGRLRDARAQKLLPQAFIDLLCNGFRPDTVCYRSGEFYQLLFQLLLIRCARRMNCL